MRNSGASVFYIPGLPTMRGHLYRPKARGSGDELTLTITEMILIFVSVHRLSSICYIDRKMTYNRRVSLHHSAVVHQHS